MTKKWTAWMIAAIVSLVLASGASAHVTVWPKEVPKGSYEVFTVRVPSETKGTETVKVELRIPDGYQAGRIQPVPGWSYSLERDANDRITSIVWEAEGKGLADTEFIEFKINGKVADDAVELVWKAYQTYADGSVVEWVGAPDADKPASVTAVVDGAPQADGHGAAPSGAADADKDHAADEAQTAAGGKPDTATLALSIAALVVAIAALIAALARRRRV
ncbi:YcnI family protein [Paenibacillus cisolokensis]|uniref:YcnI family copper-binding membrane protein n=1 Tax=Paenibacillus cisolokensis TaxID=1658519 RepID=UPI003D2BF708